MGSIKNLRSAKGKGANIPKVEQKISPTVDLVKKIKAHTRALVTRKQAKEPIAYFPSAIKEWIAKQEEQMYVSPRGMAHLIKIWEYNNLSEKIGLEDFVKNSLCALTVFGMKIEGIARGTWNKRVQDTLLLKLDDGYKIVKKSSYDKLPNSHELKQTKKPKRKIICGYPLPGQNAEALAAVTDEETSGIVLVTKDSAGLMSKILLSSEQLIQYKAGNVVNVPTVVEEEEIVGIAPVNSDGNGGVLGWWIVFSWDGGLDISWGSSDGAIGGSIHLP